MVRGVISALSRVYRSTPSPALRRLYYRMFCYVVRDRIARTSIDGLTYELDLGEVIDLATYLHSYEPDVTSAIQQYCRPGMTVFDIGANIGAHTLRFGKIVGPAGKVFAFEPTDYAYGKLHRNLLLNPFPWVSAIKVALADTNVASESVRFRSSWRTDNSRADSPSVVEVTRLDDWCARNSIRDVDIVKMDVDGNEFPILMGGYDIIKRCLPLMLMEAVGLHFEAEATNPFRVLVELSYRFWNARSGEEYKCPSDMKALLPSRDWGMTKSINIVAAVALPECEGLLRGKH
jgi:FkbM family methyltransferase